MFLNIGAVFLVIAIGFGSKLDQDYTDVLVARCRARCLKKCWDTCHMFYKNFKVWGPMCSEEHACFPGCQESCDFYRSHSPINETASTNLNLTQSLKYNYIQDKDLVHFEWPTPAGYNHIEPLVYILAMQDQLTAGWQQLEQTFFQNFTVQPNQLKLFTRIRLTSYNSNGKVAEVEKLCAEFNFDFNDERNNLMFRDEKHFSGAARGNQPDILHHDRVDHSWAAIVTSLHYSTKHLGGVDVNIKWPQMYRSAKVVFKVGWKEADPTSEGISRLYTHSNMVTITVRSKHVYLVNIRAFLNESLRSIAQSKTLIVDTNSDILGESPLVNGCLERISVEYVIFITAGLIYVIIMVLYIFVSFWQRERNLNAESRKPPSSSSQNEKGPSLNNRSLKQQLSSMSARISQGPLTPKGQHGCFIEKQVSFPFQQANGKNSHRPC
ncbi:uncharacterized protein LOC111251291 [Varroa destructor]|uniref:Uncharacterized protein n=1 Tax=Varroa destructor TaxID=109461 RepID=A0A7M7KNA0_VARDE|nr:uncharacterized protein LOC111251291 [Varroa destructor]